MPPATNRPERIEEGILFPDLHGRWWNHRCRLCEKSSTFYIAHARLLQKETVWRILFGVENRWTVGGLWQCLQMTAFLHEWKLKVANSTSSKRALRVLFCCLLWVWWLNLAAIKTRCIVSEVILVLNAHKKTLHDKTRVQQPNVLMSQFSVRTVRSLYNSTHPAVNVA